MDLPFTIIGTSTTIERNVSVAYSYWKVITGFVVF